MFKQIGQFAVRYRWLIVIGWIAIVPLVVLNFPSLSSVTQSNNSDFLPNSSPSKQAANLATSFQGKNTFTTTILIASVSSQHLTTADNEAISQVEANIAKVEDITVVKDAGVSNDNQARQAVIGISSAGVSNTTTKKNLIDNIRHIMNQSVPSGLSFNLTGQLASEVDAASSTNKDQNVTEIYSIIFIIVLLLIVYRSILAPLITLLPAGLSLIIAGPVIARAAQSGLMVSPVSQILLIVLILGAGTDYGLFLVFRVREEMHKGLDSKQAIIYAMSRVGESITFSAATVIIALLSLVFASFGLYRGLGPALAIGLAITLVAALTLLPALLAIFGRIAFWPTKVNKRQSSLGLWGKVALKVVHRPLLTIALGLALFIGLALGIVGFKTTGFVDNSAPNNSDSAVGSASLLKHFPSANNNPEHLFLSFNTSVWSSPTTIARAQQLLSSDSIFKSIEGPLNSGGINLTTQQLLTLYNRFGSPSKLKLDPAKKLNISAVLYRAYRSTAQFISPDGREIQFYATLRAGSSGSSAAMQAIPSVRDTLTTIANKLHAIDSGVTGLDATTYDISSAATSDLRLIIPIVLIIIAVLLAILLRSLVAPWYLIMTVGLSYLASLGFVMIVFVHIAGDSGLNFILPFLMFVFSMALGEDYNILTMSRIREEALVEPSIKKAVSHSIGLTGGTITSAGLILAGTFLILGIGGGSSQTEQIGIGIAFGILLDTLFVRTLLVPSIVVLLGRLNWWPSNLSKADNAKKI